MQLYVNLVTIYDPPYLLFRTVAQQEAPEPQKEIDGPFRLDPEFMERLEKMKPPPMQFPPLLKVDMAFLDEEIRIPTWEEARQQ